MRRDNRMVGLRRRRIVGVMIIVACLLTVAGTAWAAELAPDAGEVYRLEKGQVIQDDLYVSAGEIFIDGTVEGDLVAAGGYVEVNGVVTGDALVAGASIVINGVVQDDVRAAGAAVDIFGTVGGDLLAAAGGNQGFMFPFNTSGRSITPGLRIAEGATIGQDALLGAGSATVDGAIGRHLYVGAGELNLNGEVMGDAWLYANTLNVSDAATVEGTLHYPSDATVTIPPSVATEVIVAPAGSDVDEATNVTVAPVSTSDTVFKWLLSTVLLLVGFALLGWLLMRFSPVCSWRQQTPLQRIQPWRS
jgi:cytoskeletal protein CcmA (bactofilin family)